MLALAARRRNGTCGKPRSSRIGTGLAIIISSNVHLHSGTNAAKPGHGGARNRADRVSYGLTEKQVRDILAAVVRASAIGLPLNRHWTVHWGRMGVADDKACAVTGALLTLIRDWLRKQGHRFACVWVRENDDGDGSKGSHVHILLHVPEKARWCGWRNRRWLERVTGRRYAAGAGRTRTVGRSRNAAEASPDSYNANLGAVAGYVTKCTLVAGLGALRGAARQPAAKLVGKRCGRSGLLARTSMGTS